MSIILTKKRHEGGIMADGVVSVHQGSNPARDAVQSDEVKLTTTWKRAAAYLLDLFLLNAVLSIITAGRFSVMMWTWNGVDTIHILLLHWVIFLTLHWLYFKYTGKSIGRSLGQRWFRIAIVHDDGTILGENHWGPRSFAKLRYAIPIIGWFIGIADLLKYHKSEDHRTRIDLSNHTVSAVDWSLPQMTRERLR